MTPIAVAEKILKPIIGMRPPSPARERLMPNDRLPGSSSCGRHVTHEAHVSIATAEPGRSWLDAQAVNAGLTHSHCGRQAGDESQENHATAEPGHRARGAQDFLAGLTLLTTERKAQ